MRAIWKGAVAFGLVNVPVKLYAATGEHEVPLHQVHRKDAGRIRYKKTCSVCGEPVEMSDIAKGYQTDDGEIVVLTDEDFAELPLATEREISVLEFVPSEQVDPILLAKTYYLEPEKTAAKPYALLREALEASDRMAVVKVALRQRESMAVLRVRGDVICLQTLLWPDEVRAADFPVLDTDISVRPQELQMASSLVDSLAADFDPSAFEDRYQSALEAMIESKVSAGGTRPTPVSGDDGAKGGAEVIDLLAALQRSVEKAREARGAPARGAGETSSGRAKATAAGGGDGGKAADGAATTAPARERPAARAGSPRGAAAKAAAAKTAAAGSTASKSTATKSTATKSTATKRTATKRTATKRTPASSGVSKTAAAKTTAAKSAAAKTTAPKTAPAKTAAVTRGAAKPAARSTTRRRAS